jgi:AcrR family transcriptional regulator
MRKLRATSPALATASDGRLRRTERSREAIVRALFDLVREGDLRPSAHRVAKRAGVGIRTVFRHFSEMDTLFAKMSERLLAEIRPMQTGGPPPGGIAERVHALVARRAALFERIAPYRRSGDLQRWKSRFLQQQHKTTMSILRAEMLAWLPELGGAPVALVDGLDACLSFETWNRLRAEQGLSARRVEAAMEQIAQALLARAAAPASSQTGT